MLRYLLSFILFLLSSNAYAQFTTVIEWRSINTDNSGDTIFYDPDRKLDWNDFKGTPVESSIAAAITESGFGYRMSMQSKNGRTTVNITVFCYFNKMRSWVKPGMDSDYALTHEQHHFDITYINTCLFIRKLRAAGFTSKNFGDLVDKIYNESYHALNKMQDDYDGDTQNGRLKRMQFAWNKKIDDFLDSLITN